MSEYRSQIVGELAKALINAQPQLGMPTIRSPEQVRHLEQRHGLMP